MSSERDRESDGMKRRECECVISINRFGLFSKYFLFLITSINDPSVFFFCFKKVSFDEIFTNPPHSYDRLKIIIIINHILLYTIDQWIRMI